MGISNETQTFIMSVVDANQEYNTKVILLFSMLGYSLAMFIFSFWIEKHDERWDVNGNNFLISRALLNRAFRWMSGSYIFIFLLMFLLLYRTVPLERLLQLVFALYIPFFGAFAIFGIMYFYDIVLDFTGLRGRKQRNMRKNR